MKAEPILPIGTVLCSAYHPDSLVTFFGPQSHPFIKLDGSDYNAPTPCLATIVGTLSTDRTRYVLLVDGVLVTENMGQMHGWDVL